MKEFDIKNKISSGKNNEDVLFSKLDFFFSSIESQLVSQPINFNSNSSSSIYFERKKVFMLNWKVYYRITIEVQDGSQLGKILDDSRIQKRFDVIALKPTHLEQISTIIGLKGGFDVVTLDDFYYFSAKNKIKEGMRRNIHYELNYGLRTMKNQDKQQEYSYEMRFKGFLRDLTALMRLTKGKNLILSNGSGLKTDLKTASDVAAIGAFCGLEPYGKSVALVSNNCKSALAHGRLRKLFIKGAIEVIPVLNNGAAVSFSQKNQSFSSSSKKATNKKQKGPLKTEETTIQEAEDDHIESE